MDKFISTYGKDYSHPDVLDLCPSRPPITKDVTYICVESERLKKLFNLSGEICDQSRMRSALDSKPCPSQMRLIPETSYSRFDQPSPAFKTLEIRCPAIYGRIEKSSSCEKITPGETRAELMTTTYQRDYSDPAAERMVEHEKALSSIKVDDLSCRLPIKITIEADCPSRCPDVKKPDYRRKSELKRKKCEDRGKVARLQPWKSEYQDGISKIGQSIIKAKLHHTKKKAVPVLIISN